MNQASNRRVLTERTGIMHIVIAAIASAALVACFFAPCAWAASDTPSTAANLTVQAGKKSLSTLSKQGKLKVANVKSRYYVDKALKPKPTVKLNGKKLKLGTDYKITYKNAKGKTVSPRKAGVYKVVVTGIGKYKGSVSKKFIIKKNPLLIKTSAFKLSLPERWRGKVKVGAVKRSPMGYPNDVYGIPVRTKDGKAELLMLVWYPSSKWDSLPLIGDYPVVAEKTGSKYSLAVCSCAWSLNFGWGAVYNWPKKTANTVANLMTGGKIKTEAKYKAQSKDINECVEAYAKKAILKKAKIK